MFLQLFNQGPYPEYEQIMECLHKIWFWFINQTSVYG